MSLLCLPWGGTTRGSPISVQPRAVGVLLWPWLIPSPYWGLLMDALTSTQLCSLHSDPTGLCQLWGWPAAGDSVPDAQAGPYSHWRDSVYLLPMVWANLNKWWLHLYPQRKAINICSNVIPWNFRYRRISCLKHRLSPAWLNHQPSCLGEWKWRESCLGLLWRWQGPLQVTD